MAGCSWCHRTLGESGFKLMVTPPGGGAGWAYFCSNRCQHEWERAGKPGIPLYSDPPKGKLSLAAAARWLKDAITKPTE
jgi:hypothetical protein